MGSADLSFQSLYLKDADFIRKWPIPEAFREETAALKNRMKAYHPSHKTGELLRLRFKGKVIGLLAWTPSPFSSCGNAARVYLQKKYPGAAEDLAQALFERYLNAYDADIMFDADFAPDDPGKVLNEKGWEGSNGQFVSAASFSFCRPECTRYPSLHFRKSGISILVTADLKLNTLISCKFISKGEQPEHAEDRFFLNYMNLLDENGRYDPDREEAVHEKVLPELLQKTKLEIEEYLNGEREQFDLPYSLEGSEFQKKAWACLANIPYGVAISYEELAARITGNPKRAKSYARAAGMACASNPLAIIVPCHRVIGSKGELKGFTGGVDIKAKLLNLELFNYARHEKPSKP